MDIYSWSVDVAGYGSAWRRRRHLFHKFFSAKAVTNFDDYQRKHAHRFISRLSRTPDDFLDHTKLCVPPDELFHHSTQARLTLLPSVTGAPIMGITYGLDIKSHENEFLQTAERALEFAERAMVPGAFLVDTFPIRPSIL